jgi:hypothetical protein
VIIWCLDGIDAYAKDLKIVRLTDAGHLPMRTHAPAVNFAIRDFQGGRAEWRPSQIASA